MRILNSLRTDRGCRRMQRHRVTVAGGAQAVRGPGAVHPDAAGAERAGGAGARLDGLAGQCGGLAAVAVGGRAGGHDRAARCRARRAPGCAAGRPGRSGPGPTSAAGRRRDRPGRPRPGRRCAGSASPAARGPMVRRAGRSQEQPKNRCSTTVPSCVALAGSSALTPGRSGQRQHEERQQHGTVRRRGVAAREVVCGAGMRDITPQSRSVVKFAAVEPVADVGALGALRALLAVICWV